ncbi:hypothetical protein SASPL_120737 [Salvia splendens]|uniref:AB hydrolase-1 domain-containing protein n=1 Tax=Salvia splendens TaxID=180675 RepID=A0A8X8XV54_SALSN|nr:epoxide hydrolase B-like [Salvia splendens]KAG6418533.1 hypothetical protein SASPL_120737 [Salvia splendens]
MQRVATINQDETDDPTTLADSDSCFSTFNGVQIHYKISDPLQQGTKRVTHPIILLHGFGASVYSWSRVMKPLANATGSQVVAFDRPAFGLTSRGQTSSGSRPLNPYSMMFSALATMHFIDFLGADKSILVGHSAGAPVAVDTYFEAPERVAALILVAPAILAPFSIKSAVKENQKGNNQNQRKSLDSNTRDNFVFMFGSLLMVLTKWIGGMIYCLYQKTLSAILLSAFGLTLIRMIIDKFGAQAVGVAWYDSKQVTDDVLQGYTKPLRVKGWDRALLEFAVTILTDSASVSKDKRLSEISCPVLIITGDTDRLVPSWNSERLARAIPGSSFRVIDKCGHVPHEEKAHEFLSIVDEFLQGVLEAPPQAAT